MISIIICSKYAELNKLLRENIDKTVGVEYEIIHIDNSQNRYSIFSAYNMGWEKSKYPYTCFVHEDVLFRTQNWGVKVIKHLQNRDCGFVGVAGGPLLTRVPGSWSDNGGFVSIIQSGQKNKKRVHRPHRFKGISREAVLLDGVFLCARKELMQTVSFDEDFNGFHIYDLDVSIKSHLAGYTNYVIYDVLLEHFSRGNRNKHYFENLLQLFDKWSNELPLYTKSYQIKNRIYLSILEWWKLKKLLIKLVKNNFPTSQIVETVIHYSPKTKGLFSKICEKWIFLQIYFVKMFIRKKQPCTNNFNRKVR